MTLQHLEKSPLPNGLGEFGIGPRPGSIPTLASISNLFKYSKMQKPEEAGASESASDFNTRLLPSQYPGITRPSLATTGFAARLV